MSLTRWPLAKITLLQLSDILQSALNTIWGHADAAVWCQTLMNAHVHGGVGSPDAPRVVQMKNEALAHKVGSPLEVFEDGAMYATDSTRCSVRVRATWVRSDHDMASRMMFGPGGVPTSTAHMMLARTAHICFGRVMTPVSPYRIPLFV